MNGFDSQFKNLKDFILKITYRIWEERGVERIRDYYGEKAPVKTPTSVSDNVEDVISSTYKTLQMFPDRELLMLGLKYLQMKKHFLQTIE